MIILFRPLPPFVEFCKVENDKISIDKVLLDQDGINKIIEDVGAEGQLEGIGCLLKHGGELFAETASLINEEILNKVSESIRLAPEYNELTLKVARVFFEKFSGIPQVLFCDTAYFSNLPDEASTYAVPYVLREQGIRRYGGYGLIHNWIWKRTQQYDGRNINKIVSIRLGDTPNIAAIKEGMPVETTIGFTSVEGLPSFQGCGDIDPTIVFQLNSSGVSLQEIHNLLSNDSGFSGFSGQTCHYLDVIKNKPTTDIFKVKEILRYDIIKYIGAYVSLLGGVDALVFSASYLKESERFIKEICNRLNFLGLIREKSQDIKSPVQELTKKGSKIKVLCMEQSQRDIMAQAVKKTIKKGVII